MEKRTPVQTLRWFGSGLLWVGGAVAYANTCQVPFLMDDRESILENPSLQSLWTAFRPPDHSGITVGGRPLLNASFALNRWLSHESLTGFHVTNLLIHIAAAFVLWGLIDRVLSRSKAGERGATPILFFSFAVALVWELHPLQTSAVTYLAQRAESLGGLFFLLTAYCFARACDSRDSGGRWKAGCVIACFCGVATKEHVAMAPLAVLLLDRVYYSGSFLKALRDRRGLYLSLGASWILAGVLLVGSGSRGETVGFSAGVPWSQHLATQCYAFARYVQLVFWPSPLVFDYGRLLVTDPAVIALSASACVLIVTVLGWACWRRLEVMGLAVALALPLVVTLIVPVATQTVAEHRLYLPLAGLILPVAWVVYAKADRRCAVSLLVCLALGAGLLTFARNSVYGSAEGLWRDTAEKRPENVRAWYSLASHYRETNQWPEALSAYRRMLTVDEDSTVALSGLAAMHSMLGEEAVAVRLFEQSLATCGADEKKSAPIHYNLAIALVRLGDARKALAQLRIASLDERFTEKAYTMMPSLCDQLGLKGDAIDACRALLLRWPESENRRVELGMRLVNAGRAGEAMAVLRKGIEMTPQSEELKYWLAIALSELGRQKEARLLWEDCLAKRSGWGEAHLGLGIVLQLEGEPAAACQQMEQAENAGVVTAGGYLSWGRALLELGQVEAAISKLQRVVQQDYRNWQAKYVLAEALLKKESASEASLLLEQVLVQMPDFPDAQNRLGVCYAMMGRQAEARQQFLDVLRKNTGHIDARINLETLESPKGGRREGGFRNHQ